MNDLRNPFQELVILELASVLAGPSVGQFFAELGATVIKIENTETQGDVTRKWKTITEDPETDISAYFSCANWGKKSVALNLKHPEELALLHKLAAKADVVLASYKPGDAEKLHVDYKSLASLNPKLIYGHITGYGPNAIRAGYDAVLQAETGFMHLNGQADGPPTKMPVALIDVLAAHQLKEGILAALWAREKTGKGQLIQVSLRDAALASLANQAANYLVAGQNPKRLGSEHPNIVPYGTVYEDLEDKPLVLAIGDDRQFSNLCSILGQPELADKPEFKTNNQRVKNREALQKHLKSQIKTWNREALLQKLIEKNVPAGAVYNIAEVFSKPDAQAMLLKTSENEPFFKGRGVKQVAFKWQSYPDITTLPAPPAFGQHTAEVKQELGLATDNDPEHLGKMPSGDR